MEKAAAHCTADAEWRALYKAAILETRRTEIPRRVTAAESAVLARGREVFYTEASLDEKEALEDALYILRVYRTSWEQTGGRKQNSRNNREAVAVRAANAS